MKFNITIKDIREKNPCYDPEKYLPKEWSGTLLDVLDIKECPFDDRLWVVTHFLDDKLNRLFAVYCARQALALVETPDVRSVNACDVAERFALGLATSIELYVARDAARVAAWDAARVAVWDAARDAARVAVWDAARVAALAAAREAVWDIALVAALAAAREAVWADFELYLRLLIKDELENK